MSQVLSVIILVTGSGEAVIYMENNHEKNKRIAKNTLLLYFRMFLIMGINLYTSRVLLKALGIDDYGIYNVIGGVVAAFSIVSASLSEAIRRFITFEIGIGNVKKINDIFCTAINIQIILSLIVIIFAETIGLWFINSKMNIPETRIFATNIVYQFSLLSFVVQMISIPYNSIIIAYEKMSAFAYISILEVACKLLLIYLIFVIPYDHLIVYSVFMFASSIFIRLIYGTYCKKKFSVCKYQIKWNKQLLQEMFSFAGWNFIGSASVLLRDHGGNILLNIFFGPSTNAARAISTQVSNAVVNFSGNFMTAINPQITKSYAAKEFDYLNFLIETSCKFSFYILLFISTPILLNTNYILSVWLGKVPNETIIFVQLSVIFAISQSLSRPLLTAQLSTGHIKNYQIIIGGFQLLNLPISYILLKLQLKPESIYWVAIIISQICLFLSIIILQKEINIKLTCFIKNVYIKVIVVFGVSFLLSLYTCKQASTFFNFILTSIVSCFFTAMSIIFLGCNKKEKSFIYRKLKNKISI